MRHSAVPSPLKMKPIAFWRTFFIAIAFLGAMHFQAIAQQSRSEPKRIVSLMPALTETVCDLGACARLVGVDDYSDYPLSVHSLPKMGGLGQTRIEAIVRLKPDLVLAPRSLRVADRLRSLGLKVLILEPQNTKEVHSAYLQVGAALGLETDFVAKKWRDIEQGIERATQHTPVAQKGKKVYFEVSAAPYAAGQASFIGELMVRLGMRNIVPADLGAFPKLSTEFVLRQKPDLLISASGNAKSGGSRALQILSQSGVPLCTLSKGQNDALVRPGPRMAEAAEALLQCMDKLR
jgi:iron complex transport system substrate-binding protein